MKTNNERVSPNQFASSRPAVDIDLEFSDGVYELRRVREILVNNNIESDVTDLAVTLETMTERGLIEWALKDNKYTTRVKFQQLKDPVDCELFVNGDSPRPHIILRVSQEESQNQVSWSYYFGHGDGSGNLLDCVAGKVLGLSSSEAWRRYVKLHPRYAVRGFETGDEGE